MRVVSKLLATLLVLGSAMIVAVGTLHPARAQGASSALTRYPYASEVVGTSATVNWATNRSQSSGSVTWGAVSNGTCTPSNRVSATGVPITVGSTSEYQWSARLTFPGPGAYCYRPRLGATDLLGSAPSPQVETAAAPGSAFSFAVVGDWGAGSAGEAGVMSQIGSSPASFVVSVGDNAYMNGSQTDYGDLTRGNVFRSAYLPKIGGRPIFAVQGNHGFANNLPYLQNFPAPLASQTSGGRNLQESYCCTSTRSGSQKYASSWYAFDWGGARFYVLEAAWADGEGYAGDFLAHWKGAVAGCGPCGAELAWLKADLAAHPRTALKFAFFHFPLHADSSSEGSDTYLDGPGGLEGLLAANHVDVVFNGHTHIYERNLPQIPGTPMVSYVTGAGGAPLGSVSGCSSFDAYAIGTRSSCRAPKPTSDAHVYHYLLVTVNGNQVTVTPTDSTGQTFDRQTYNFAPATPKPIPVLSKLRVRPPTFSPAGRRVNGRCVRRTSKNNTKKHCRLPIKLRIRYALNLAVSVDFTLERQASGRKVNGHCVKPTTKNRQYPRCRRLVGRGENITRPGKAGANSFIFGAKISGRTLGPGSYRLTATPTGGTPKTVSFRLKP
jgi:acid phosphatase type 7